MLTGGVLTGNLIIANTVGNVNILRLNNNSHQRIVLSNTNPSNIGLLEIRFQQSEVLGAWIQYSSSWISTSHLEISTARNDIPIFVRIN